MSSCPVCKSYSLKNEIAKFNLTMSECQNCKFVFTDKVPENSDHRYGPDWFEKEYLPSFGINPESPVTDHLSSRFDVDLMLIEKYIKKGRLLDVGAGAGLLLNRAKQRGWDVFGIEPAGPGVNFARKHFGIEMFQGLLKDAQLKEASFDAVILQDVIEHVTNPVDVVSDIRRLLKPGGILLVTTPNYGALSRNVFRSNWALISPAEHVSLFRPSVLERTVKQGGFKTLLHNSTNEILISRTHFEEQRWIKYRRFILRNLVLFLPSVFVCKFKLGDELTLVAEAI